MLADLTHPLPHHLFLHRIRYVPAVAALDPDALHPSRRSLYLPTATPHALVLFSLFPTISRLLLPLFHPHSLDQVYVSRQESRDDVGTNRYNRHVQVTQGERSALTFFPSDKVPRPEQVQAIKGIEKAFKEGKKTVALSAPTGVGKSAICVAHAKEVADRGGKVHILTPQKMLQHQYQVEYGPPLIEIMKGRANYLCNFKPEAQNAARGYCRTARKKGIIQECLRFGSPEAASDLSLPPDAHLCDYWRQLQKANDNPITLFNFHSFLFQQRLGRFGKRDLLVIDECHNTEAVLLQFVEIVLSDRVLQIIGVHIDLSMSTAKSVVEWLEREQVSEKIKKAVGDKQQGENVSENLTPQEADQLRGLLERIEDLKRYLSMTEWVVDVFQDTLPDGTLDKTRKLRVRPVFIRPFTKEILFSKADTVIAMSATILDPKAWARNLGIPGANFGFVEVDSPFPVKNRPIIKEYAGDMGWKNFTSTLPNLFKTIESILDRHDDQRGIIHGHSEKLCKLIYENVKNPRIIHLGQFDNRDKSLMLQAHARKSNSVLLASGLHEGIDLKDELSRFQIIPKIPWPGTEDKFVKARMEIDKAYLSTQAALKLIQSYGRSCRHKEDWTKTFILDSGFETFLSRCGWLLPKWFVAAIEKTHH